MKLLNSQKHIFIPILLLVYLSIQCTAQVDTHDDHSHDSHDHGDHGHEHSHDDHDDLSHDDHSHEGHTDNHSENSAVVVTQYVGDSELFMEYPSLIKGHKAKLIVHLTKLSDFTPVTKGRLQVNLISPYGERYTVTLTAPARDGIFLPELVPPFIGDSRMELKLTSEQLNVTHIIENVLVYSDVHEIHHHEEEGENPNHVSFLKEQQWKIDYRLSPAEMSKIAATVPGIGTASIPHQGRFVLPAPIDGLVFPFDETEVEKGISFEADQSVFIIKPSASWVDGISKLRQEYLTAQIELEKLKRLHESNAASSERLRLSQIKVDTLQQSVEALGLDANDLSAAEMEVEVATPRSAMLDEILVSSGQRTKAGDPLALFLDDSILMIEVKVPSSRVLQLGQISDAMIQPVGSTKVYKISELGGKLISSRVQRSSEGGMSLIRFSIPNEEGLFFDGMQFQVHLMDASDTLETVTIPKSAILEESGIPMVYVQIEGETIEKRYVKLGKSDGTQVEILSGVSAGEYVVTRGGAYIRLASLATTEMGHGHSH